MNRPQDDEELLKKLRTHRKNILLALHRKGELATRELREESGFPVGSRNHHLGLLEDWGLIEIIGRVGEENERVFALTDRGASFTRDVLEAEVSEDVELRIEQLERRIDGLENEMEDVEKRFVSVTRFESLVDRLQDDYRESIMQEIDSKINQRV